MSQYLIAVYNGPDTRSRPAGEMNEIVAAVDEVNQRAMEAGSFVFAGGLHDQNATTTVDPRAGTPELSDGPYLESKEYIGGFWVIEAADLDAALDFAREASLACREVLEVRPFMDGPPEGV
jgi:hypothetical protein